MWSCLMWEKILLRNHLYGEECFSFCRQGHQ
jgi:hypothetical protein